MFSWESDCGFIFVLVIWNVFKLYFLCSVQHFDLKALYKCSSIIIIIIIIITTTCLLLPRYPCISPCPVSDHCVSCLYSWVLVFPVSLSVPGLWFCIFYVLLNHQNVPLLPSLHFGSAIHQLPHNRQGWRGAITSTWWTWSSQMFTSQL